MKNWLVKTAICTGMILGGGIMNPSFAGHWVEVPNPHSDEYENPWDYDPESQAYQDWQQAHVERYNGETETETLYDSHQFAWNDLGEWANGYHSFIGGTQGTSFRYTSQGTVKRKFEWIRNIVNGQEDPDDHPEPYLWLKVYIKSEAMGNAINIISPSSITLKLNADGVEETTTTIPGAFGGFEKTAIAENIRLLAIPTNGHPVVWTPPFDISINIEVTQFSSPNPDPQIMAAQETIFSAQPDNRRLHLTRTGAIGEIVSGNTTYGHSRFSYIEQQTPLPVDAPQVQGYVRNISGDWGIDPDWEWSPASIDEAAMYSTQTNEYGNLTKDAQGKWTGTPTTPRVQTTKYTLTDPIDGTVGEAVYELILHDAYEKKSEDPLTTTMQNLRPHPYAIPGRASGPNQTVTVGLSNSYTWTVGGSFGGTIEAAQIATLDASIELSRSATVESNASIAVPVPEGWETYLQIYDRVDTRSGQAHSWLPTGYNGEVSWEVTYPSNTPTHFGVQAAPPYPIEEED